MTSILAIETSGGACSVALSRGGDIISEMEETPREHARKVLPMVESVLARAGLSVKSLDAIAFTRGPGSFTGLRIGFGVVQGLAFGCDIPVIGVSTLQCLAFKAARVFAPKAGLVVPALDARMGEIYWGVYRTDVDGLPQAEVADEAITPDAALPAMPEEIDCAVGEGWTLLDHHALGIRHYQPDMIADAETLALMAVDLFQCNQHENILSAELAYVRNEVSWKKRSKIRRSG